MSSNLYWEPKKRKRYEVPIEIKMALRKRFDGCANLTGCELGSGDMEYLMGLRDGGVDGVEKLIEGVERYDTIVLYEEF